MKRKVVKRFMAFLLTLVMLLPIMPMSVWAAIADGNVTIDVDNTGDFGEIGIGAVAGNNLTITVKNHSLYFASGQVDISLTGPDAGKFNLSATSIADIGADSSDSSVNVSLRTADLTAAGIGTYNAEVRIEYGGGFYNVFPITVEVVDAVRMIAVDDIFFAFRAINTSRPAAQSINIDFHNDDNLKDAVIYSVALEKGAASDFEIAGTGTAIPSTNYTIQPKASTMGFIDYYYDRIVVKYWNGSDISTIDEIEADVCFAVEDLYISFDVAIFADGNFPTTPIGASPPADAETLYIFNLSNVDVEIIGLKIVNKNNTNPNPNFDVANNVANDIISVGDYNNDGSIKVEPTIDTSSASLFEARVQVELQPEGEPSSTFIYHDLIFGVGAAVAEINVSPLSKTFVIGSLFLPDANIVPNDAINKNLVWIEDIPGGAISGVITWDSSAQKIKAIGTGTTRIKAYALDGSLTESDWIYITVIDPPGSTKKSKSSSAPSGGTAEPATEIETPAKQPLLYQVTASLLNERSGPGMNFRRVGTLPRGTILEIKEFSPCGQWVLTHTGTWVAVRFLTKISGPETTSGATTQWVVDVSQMGRLNVRAAASHTSPRVGTLRRGDVVQVRSISNGWAEISYTNQVPVAYVSTQFLRRQ